MSTQIGADHLTVDQVAQVARLGQHIVIDPACTSKIDQCRELVLKLIEDGVAIYGVTTGIGEFANISISKEQCEDLQKRIIYSHCASTGDIQPPDVVKAAMLLRAHMLAHGHSGVRRVLIDTLVEMVNKGVIPLVYEKGSVGCSGDLSPLSMLAIAVIGEGEAFFEGERLPGGEAMRRAGIEPITPTAKEGLGLINGTQMMTGESALLLCDTRRLYKQALIAYAMSLDALNAVESPYDARVHAIRPYHGSQAAATALRQVWAGSEIMAGKSGKVQDGYSMRCTPQVMGASIDAFHYATQQIETEMNSVIDNPLFFPDDTDYIGAGNFHGQPVAMAMDFIAIATSEVASLSERHTNRMLNPTLSGLPDFLVEGKGLNSGLMVAQYTQAALCSENRVFCHPAVVDNVSVSADQEDHVNMGPIAVRKYKEIIKNTRTVLAIEVMSACQAFDFRMRGRTRNSFDAAKVKPGKGCQAVYDMVRSKVPFLEDDRPLVYDIDAIIELMDSGSILQAAEAAVGDIRL